MHQKSVDIYKFNQRPKGKIDAWKKYTYEKATRESNSMDCRHKILQIRVYNAFSVFW